MDPPEKSLHRRKLDFDHLVRDVSMRLFVDPIGSLLVWRIDQAKCRPALGIVPIGEKLHAVRSLDFEILDVQLCDVLSGRLGNVVAIQEDRHRFPHG